MEPNFKMWSPTFKPCKIKKHSTIVKKNYNKKLLTGSSDSLKASTLSFILFLQKTLIGYVDTKNKISHWG